MPEDDLQSKIYGFIPKIVEIEYLNSPKPEIEQKGSVADREIVDWSDLRSDGPVFIRQPFVDFTDQKLYILIDKIKFGFAQESVYKEFYRYIHDLVSYNNMQEKVSADYMREKILLWIVDVHIKGKVTEPLFVYISRLVEKDVNNYTYYFPILNIEVDEEFSIGKSKITFFTKQYLEDFYNKELSQVREEYDKLFGDFKGKALVAVNVNAEKKLAQELAFRNASYAVDVLKLTGPTVIIPSEKCYIELESKMPFSYQYLSFKDNDISQFSYHEGVNREHHLRYTSEMIGNWHEIFNSLGSLNEKQDELSILVANSVKFFSKCLSEEDLHLRISQLVMIIEGIFLKDSERKDIVIKCKTRFLQFLFGPNEINKENFKQVLNNMYDIRHKMTHKSKRLFIDNAELARFQLEIVHVLLQLSKQSKINFQKENFLNFLYESATK